jgi:sarcosine oxidase, subunit alpha
MAEPFRLSGHEGRPLNFTFDGRAMTGREGDTLASALLANGVRLLARSFKYHRPRGLVTAGVEEPNAIVAIGRGAYLDTNTPATRVALVEGLDARSLNNWPSLQWDAGAIFSAIGRFIPAGFYYKTFFWPNWHSFEPTIRRAAGLGEAPTEPDVDRYESPHLHCDVLVVGAGPAGLAAALRAGRAGVDVVLCEQDEVLGGSAGDEDTQIGGNNATHWVAEVFAELAAMSNVRIMCKTTVAAYHDHNFLLAVERLDSAGAAVCERCWHIRAGRVILATGAIERPLVFPDNDRPGIMMSSAIRHYVQRHRVAPGNRVVVVTNNSDAYRTIQVLINNGIDVAAIVDSRASAPSEFAGVQVDRGTLIVGTTGRNALSSVTLRSLDGGTTRRVFCDTLAVSGGWSPAVQLFSQSQGHLRYDDVIASFVPDHSGQAVNCAGAAAGFMHLTDCLQSGIDAAATALSALDIAVPEMDRWSTSEETPYSIEPIWRTPEALAGSGKQWVDFHNDVTSADIALAAREGFRSVEHLKRYTTLGMAPDQGKTSNVNGLAILGEITGRTPGEVGTTTFRPPYAPIRFGTVAGRDRGALFRPLRRLPTHSLQREFGARMEDYGAWLRPSHYPLPDEDMNAAIEREIRAVRDLVGILDYSPLGKIEVAGPDALVFLNAMVATNLTTLKTGRARYSLTLTEGGAILDDGIISRLADDRFLMGTTSGAVEMIFSALDERRQRDFPMLDVFLTNVTSHWSVIMVSGPNARALLGRTDLDVDLSSDAFPHMTWRSGVLGGVPVRVNRVSFTGELSYEISIPAAYAVSLWQALFALGKDLGLTPIGIEALDVLRLEKGFIHVGGDTDGTSTPDDAGYGAMVRNKTSEFIGKRSLTLPDRIEPNRLQLVGLRPLDNDLPLGVGAQIVPADGTGHPSGLGHVTSSAWSPSLRAPIALAMLANGRSMTNERLRVWHQNGFRPVEVVAPLRYDPDGVRINE